MKAVELFAGAGGLGMGISRAGFLPKVVIEWDHYCCDTIRENQARKLKPLVHWPLFEGDVKDFDFRKISGEIDLVSGGPPCQPFSLAGKHRGRLDKRDMFPQAIRAVRELRPKAFVLENVKGLTRNSFANYLEYIRLQLSYPDLSERNDEDWEDHRSRLEQHHTKGKHKGLHYNIVMRILNAADYGVPQRRERLFIVGFRSDLGIDWAFPEPTHSEGALLWSKLETGEYWDRHKVPKRYRLIDPTSKFLAHPVLRPWRTVRDAISDLPDPETAPKLARTYPNHQFQPGARVYVGHTGSPIDEPAKTLKAGAHGVPGGEDMLLRPDGSVRYFTIRESARLQTFPDKYIFHGSWSETMRQLGNAVAVDLATIVASNIHRHLALAKTSGKA